MLASLLCGLALPLSAQSQTQAPALKMPAPAPRRPSIVLIVADDLGYGDLGCYGQTRIKTPNLDQLAAEGMRFTDFYSGSTVCAPSRCALMTGLHTGHGWIRGNAAQALRPEDRTVADILKEAGYYTALIGKWGLGKENTTGVPQNHGFNEFAGFLDQVHAHDYFTDHLWRYDPRVQDTSPDAAVAKMRAPMTLTENWGGKRGLYVHDLFTHAALRFIEINKPDPLNRYRPFFLCLAYTIPHANNEEARRSGNGMQIPSDAPYSDMPWPQPEKNKAAMITHLDADIGKLMDQLKHFKIDDNTIVIFTSDNGPHQEGGVDPNFLQSAGPLRGHKRDLYEGGIRVPLLVRWPAAIKPGQVSHLPCAFWDFLPTAAEIAGVKAPADIDGISLLPTLKGQPQTNSHPFLYWEFHERGFQQAARMGDWKAVRPQAGDPVELYNLQADLGEKTNVAPRHPDIVAKLDEYLKSARTDSKHWPIRKPAAKPAGQAQP